MTKTIDVLDESNKYIKEIQDNFIMVMRNKMDFYNKEMSRTNNRNFINFRLGEIAEI